MKVNTRHQVTEITREFPTGTGSTGVYTVYAVLDQVTGKVWTRSYNQPGWAIRRALRENEASASHMKSLPFIKEV